MNFYETKFEDYIKSNENNSLHSNISLPDDINDFENLIIYGPPGIGKYTQMLSIIKKYSPSQLKYEKKILVNYNKTIYYFKISEIHYEIDMNLLGCNAKLLWHEIFNQTIDIISTKTDKIGIIVCKYFHKIHNELLEIFYSYMQTIYNLNIHIKFILITEDLSFIPDNILNCCKHIKFSRPSKNIYNKCLKTKLTTLNNTSLITNIKDIQNDNIFNINSINSIKKNKKTKQNYNIVEADKILCDTIIEKILDINELKYMNLRILLYDICIYDYNIVNCIWYILQQLIEKKMLDNDKFSQILFETYKFFKLYNNNYRSIYHLEKYILCITEIVHN